MKMNRKKLAVIIASALVLCLVVMIAVIGVKNRDKDEPTTQPTSVTETAPTSAPTQPSTEAPTETAAANLADAILGRWMDSADMSGLEFFSNGTVSWTYVNLTVPVIGLPVNGSAKGTYTLSGDRLTVKFSIYSATIEKEYTASVNLNELTLRDVKDGEVSTYLRSDAAPATTAPVDVGRDDLIGSWVSTDATVRYAFKQDGIVDVTLSNAVLTPGASPVSGSATGIYLSQNDRLTVQYLLDGEKVTVSGAYAVSKNALSLTDDAGETTLFARGGTSVDTQSSPEDLLGTWTDKSGACSYTFLDGSIVELNYSSFKVPALVSPISGTYRGTYEVSGDRLTLRYTAMNTHLTETFTFSISDNALTLADQSSGAVRTLER